MPRKTMLLAAALMIYSLAGIANDVGNARVFADRQCKLTLPGAGFRWLDHSKIPQAVAALGNDSGTMLLMTINKAPDGFVLKESFVRGFDKSFNQPGVASKISGEIVTFRGVPCYQLHARLGQDGSIATIRAFGANGYLYQLQLVGSRLPVERRGELDGVFSAFEFTGTPSLPTSAPQTSEQQAYNFSENMGKIAGGCIIGVIILAGAGKLLGKKKDS